MGQPHLLLRGGAVLVKVRAASVHLRRQSNDRVGVRHELAAECRGTPKRQPQGSTAGANAARTEAAGAMYSGTARAHSGTSRSERNAASAAS